MAKLTIREIARMAGVSATAVSFVINNKEGISEETRKKVNEVIEKTNFKPSVNSRRLFFKKSFNISVVIRQTSSPFEDLFYFEVTKGLLAKSKEYGYNIVFTDISIQGNSVIMPEIIELKDTDGIVFLNDTDKIILNEMDRRGIPYVVVDAHSTNPDVVSVNADYELSAYTSTRYLLDNGHRNLAFIGSSSHPEFYIQSFGGFKRAIEELQLSIPFSWLQTEAIDEESSYRCMERIIKSGQIPTAVFCPTDMFAIGAMKCCKDNGFKIPSEISFAAIDNIILSKYIEPKLTTIAIDMLQMGRLAMELIVRKINGEPAESVIVKSDNLIIRDSVAKIK